MSHNVIENNDCLGEKPKNLHPVYPNFKDETDDEIESDGCVYGTCTEAYYEICIDGCVNKKEET